MPRREAVADPPPGPAPAHTKRRDRRHPHRLRLEHRHIRRTGAAGFAQRATGAWPWTLYQRGVVQTDYGLASAMGVVLLIIAVLVTLLLAALFARSAGRLSTAATSLSAPAPPRTVQPAALRRARRGTPMSGSPARVRVAVPDAARSLPDRAGRDLRGPELPVRPGQLRREPAARASSWTGLTLIIDLAHRTAGAYALVRYPFPGKRTLFSLVTLPLYVPGAVIGLALLLTTLHLPPHDVDLGARARDGRRHVPADAVAHRRRAQGPAGRVRGGRRVPRRDALPDFLAGRLPTHRPGRQRRSDAAASSSSSTSTW